MSGRLPVALVVDGAEAPFAEGVQRVGALEVDVATAPLGSGTRIDLVVRNPGRSVVRARHVGVRLEAHPRQVLEHGWQSWSVVRRCAPGDVRPERRRGPAWRRGMYLTEPDRAGAAVRGEPFLVDDGGVTAFLGGARHLSVVEADPDGWGVTALALLDGVPIRPGSARPLDPLWLAGGDPGPLYSEMARWWGGVAGARAGTPVPAGWCSWYHHYSSITPAMVRDNLGQAAAHGLGLVQLDDGWQAAIGDWRSCRATWAGGVGWLAGEASAAGLAAGIWTAPFLAAEDSRLAAEHPDWLLGRAMHNPVWWGGWSRALDTANPAVLDHVRSVFAALRAEGFTFFKLDFLYAAALRPRPARARALTRAEALRQGLDAVREAVGDDAVLLGCGCPFGPAVGVVDAMRVSPDVAPRWEPVRTVAGLAEAASCARSAVSASVLRAPLHRRLWANDPDCLLLRRAGSTLTDDQRRLLAAVVGGAGAFVLLGDDLTGYGAGEWAVVEEVLALLPAADSPVDLDDPFAPAVRARSAATELTVDWRGAGTATLTRAP